MANCVFGRDFSLCIIAVLCFHKNISGKLSISAPGQSVDDGISSATKSAPSDPKINLFDKEIFSILFCRFIYSSGFKAFTNTPHQQLEFTYHKLCKPIFCTTDNFRSVKWLSYSCALAFPTFSRSKVLAEFKIYSFCLPQWFLTLSRSKISSQFLEFVRYLLHSSTIAFILLFVLIVKHSPGKTICSLFKYVYPDIQQKGWKTDRQSLLSHETLSDIFQFRASHNDITTAFPFSLDTYFNDIIKNKSPKRDLMKYEWARYETFKDFPESCTAMPMRLAQSGFFFTGNGEEVECFCCGVKNNDWSTQETMFELHKRLSPNCKFLNGSDGLNVSIDGSQTHVAKKPDNAATGGPSDYVTEQRRHSTEITQTSNTVTTYTTTERQELHETISSANVISTSTSGNKTAMEIRHRNANSFGEPRPRQSSDLFNNAKHPDYAENNVRISTFAGWPSYSIQDPHQLADAGFYYAGFGDCVRCFYCGGGLRNWEYGDTPWEEHARWYSNCEYLKQRKGMEYIRRYQQVETHDSEDEDDLEQRVQELSFQEYNDRNDDHVEETESPIDSIAAKSVMETGYSRDVVQMALLILENSAEPREITAASIMETIIDADLDTANSNAVSEGDAIQSNHSEIPSEASSGPKRTGRRSQYDTNSNTEKTAFSTNKLPNDVSASTEGNATLHDEQSLVDENKKLKELMTCKICMDNDSCIVFLPCGHMVSCETCAPALRKCPICRKLVKSRIKAYA